MVQRERRVRVRIDAAARVFPTSECGRRRGGECEHGRDTDRANAPGRVIANAGAIATAPASGRESASLPGSAGETGRSDPLLDEPFTFVLPLATLGRVIDR